MRLYSLCLKLEGRRCLVIGGGNVAKRKVASLKECGADVLVVSPELCPELADRAARGEIQALQRAFQPEDLEGAALAIAATDNPAVNQAVAAAGKDAGVLVNVVDVPDLCDFYVPASVRRGDLEIAVSTTGAFPALAKRLRIELEGQFGPEYEAYLELLARFRRELKARIPDAAIRNRAEEAFLDSPALSLLAQHKVHEAEQVLAECAARFMSDP